MKVFISVDIEGVCGITRPEQSAYAKHDYDRARALMAGEANAAIEGALAAGAGQIVVCDSHSRQINLWPTDLNPAARLVSGNSKPGSSMMEGLDSTFDAVIFIGYHAMDGVADGVLNHTYDPKAVKKVSINGRAMGELGVNAALAGFYRVPVCLVAGDAAACREAADLLPGVATVAVKEGCGRYSALNLHPDQARGDIRDGVRQGLEDLPAHAPLTLAAPLTMDLELGDTTMADMVELIPGMERIGGKAVRFEAADYLTAYRCFRAALMIASTVWSSEY